MAGHVLHHSGLLTWFHNDTDNLEKDIKKELLNSRMDSFGNVPIYLVDNERASFLMKVIDYSEGIDSNFTFYYPRTGTSITEDVNRKGKALPLELISSDIIPVLVKKGGARELIIYTNTPYDGDVYKRLVGYSLSFATGLIDKIGIGMPDYNPAKHAEEVSSIALGFSREEEIEPFSFNASILDFLEGR